MTTTPDVDAMASQALVVWTGKGRTGWPVRDERLVVETFGGELAITLVPLIRQLADDYYSCDAYLWASGPVEMGEAAAGQFRSRHPEISEAAVEALTWCYTWDYK